MADPWEGTGDCDHCGKDTEYVMWCCSNQHVAICQECYLRLVKVESGDPIHCPLRDYEVRLIDGPVSDD